MVVVAVMLGGACDLTPRASVGPASPSVSSSAQPSGTDSRPTPTPVIPGWQVFSSVVGGYTFEHPSDWRQQGSVNDSTFIEVYFSNENVGSPEQMDAAGIFFDVTLSHDSGDLCIRHGLRAALIEGSEVLVVDATSASLYVVTSQSVGGNWPMVVLNLSHGAYCYEFSLLTMTKQGRDGNLVTVRKLLGQTFRFGSGPRPTS